MKSEILRIGEDNVCPVTHQQCDDETCTPGAECNISGEDHVSDLSSPSLDSLNIDRPRERVLAESYERVYVECPDDEENDYTMTIRKDGSVRIKEIEGLVWVMTDEQFLELLNDRKKPLPAPPSNP